MGKRQLLVALASLLICGADRFTSSADARAVFSNLDKKTKTTEVPSPRDEKDVPTRQSSHGSITSTTTASPAATSAKSPDSDFGSELAAWLLNDAMIAAAYRIRKGTYKTATSTQAPMAGRYPSKIIRVDKPTEESRKKCKFTVTASQITNGQRSVLKRGSAEVFVTLDEEGILINTVSADQRPRPPSFWGRLWKGFKSIFTSNKEYYTYYFWIPPQCSKIHWDPAGVFAEVKEGEDIKAVRFRISPEIKAYYEPSLQLPNFPFDVQAAGKNHFARLRRCLYAAELTREFMPGSLSFTSSYRVASITAKNSSGAPITLASHTISCECRPSKLGHISWWLMRNDAGNPVILLYFGYGHYRGHPVCLQQTMRQGSPGEIDGWVNYEALGLWGYR